MYFVAGFSEDDDEVVAVIKELLDNRIRYQTPEAQVLMSLRAQGSDLPERDSRLLIRRGSIVHMRTLKRYL